jgi:hypothetical protein
MRCQIFLHICNAPIVFITKVLILISKKLGSEFCISTRAARIFIQYFRNRKFLLNNIKNKSWLKPINRSAIRRMVAHISSGVLHMKLNKLFVATSATLVLSLGAAFASNAALVPQLNTQIGTLGDMQWEARSLLTGAAPGGTSGPTDSGNPIYHPTFPEYSGTVGMLMDYGPDIGAFVCSGTLMEDRRSILTAAHCVSDGAGTANPLSTTIFFQPEGGLPTDISIYGPDSAPAGTVTVDVTDYFVSEDYTGEVIDQNDVAVLRMAEEAPEWAVSHGIYTESDLTGQEFNVAGYGVRGDGAGGNAPTGRLRQGDNIYDYAWGDAAFGGFFTDRDATGENFFGLADVEFSYVSDFDNGLAANDMSGLIADLGLGLGSIFNDVGLGDREVGVAGGDSGGPNFINGLVSGINSYGLSFGTGFGDIDDGLNSSFGEFSGYVPTWIHADFINASLFDDVVEEVSSPGALALMLLGVFAVGGAARRRRAA